MSKMGSQWVGNMYEMGRKPKGLYFGNPISSNMARKSKARAIKFKVIVEKDEDKLFNHIYYKRYFFFYLKWKILLNYYGNFKGIVKYYIGVDDRLIA